MTQHFIPKHGAYEELLSYRKAVIVYDGTVCLCDRFMHRRDRTVDQMVHGAVWQAEHHQGLHGLGDIQEKRNQADHRCPRQHGRAA
jgi:hypothetical protein